jgi:hypothetical protein
MSNSKKKKKTVPWTMDRKRMRGSLSRSTTEKAVEAVVQIEARI